MRGRLVASLPIAAAALFFALFVLVPLGAMFAPTFCAADGSFTLALYGRMLREATDRTELWNSLYLGTATAGVATLLGGGFAWVTCATDLPGARWLRPLGVLPLVVPPIVVAMGFADVWPVAGFWPCALLLGIAFAPFVAVLGARGLRSVDGRQYEAALLARRRARAELLLLRSALPEFLAGAFLAFLFALAERGVPEFLTVKGKTWHTYAEGIFRRWSMRAAGLGPDAVHGPVVAAVPLVLVLAAALALALWLRARASGRASVPLPTRVLGRWRWPALTVPALYLAAGVGLPVIVMARWAMGSTQVDAPLSIATLRANLNAALTQAGGDLAHTIAVAGGAALLALVAGLPLARAAARRWGVVEHASVLPLAVPAILLGIGFVHAYNGPHVAGLYACTIDFYDSPAILVVAYAARFLPFAVLTLAGAQRRVPRTLDEVAILSGRPAVVRALRIHLPLLAPAALSAASLLFVLGLRELDTAVVLPAGNDTVVRRLANVVHFGGEDMGGALALLLLLVAVLVPGLVVLVTGRRLQSLS